MFEVLDVVLNAIEIVALFLICAAVMDLKQVFESWDQENRNIGQKDEAEKEITDFTFNREV